MPLFFSGNRNVDFENIFELLTGVIKTMGNDHAYIHQGKLF